MKAVNIPTASSSILGRFIGDLYDLNSELRLWQAGWEEPELSTQGFKRDVQMSKGERVNHTNGMNYWTTSGERKKLIKAEAQNTVQK